MHSRKFQQGVTIMAISLGLLLVWGCIFKNNKAQSLSDSNPMFDWEKYQKGCDGNDGSENAKKGLVSIPFLMTRHAYSNERLTLWWKVFRTHEVKLSNQQTIRVEVMGSKAELGLPSYEKERVEALKNDPDYRKRLETSFGAEYVRKHLDTEAERDFESLCAARGIMAMRERYTELLQFVFDQYRERYGFKEEILQEFERTASDSVANSLYISARDIKSNEILGTFRFVQAPYGRRLELSADEKVTIRDHTGDFGSAYEEIFPYRWQGHDLGAVNTDAQISRTEKTFPDEMIGRAHYNINWTVASLVGQPKFRDLEIAEKIHREGAFTPLPLETGLSIKLPRKAPVRISAAESAGEKASGNKVYYGSGILIELGNLAIKKGTESGIKIEIYKEMIAALATATTGKHVVLWNRNQRPRLYEKLGFKTWPEIFDSGGIKQSVMWAVPEDYIDALQLIVGTYRSSKAPKVSSAPQGSTVEASDCGLPEAGENSKSEQGSLAKTDSASQNESLRSAELALDCLGMEALALQEKAKP